jgi:hypothetical protein
MKRLLDLVFLVISRSNKIIRDPPDEEWGKILPIWRAFGRCTQALRMKRRLDRRTTNAENSLIEILSMKSWQKIYACAPRLATIRRIGQRVISAHLLFLKTTCRPIQLATD